MIEQPLGDDDIVDHARLQARLQTPICLDESIHTVDDCRKALDLDAARIINIKVSRLGGLGPARAVHDLCHGRGVPVWCGGMHEFGVGRAANVAHLQPARVHHPGRRLGLRPLVPARTSSIRRSARRPARSPCPGIGPGWAIEPNLERITARTLRELVLEEERAPVATR